MKLTSTTMIRVMTSLLPMIPEDMKELAVSWHENLEKVVSWMMI